MKKPDKVKQNRIERAKKEPFLHLLLDEERERFLDGEIKYSDKIHFYCEKCGNYHFMQISNYKQGQRCPCDKWIESSRRQVKAALDRIPQNVLDAMHPQDKSSLFEGKITQRNKIRFKCEHCNEWFEITTMKYRAGQRCLCQKYTKAAIARKINSAKKFEYMDAVHPEDREKMYQGVLGVCDKLRFKCGKCNEYFFMTGLKYRAGQRCGCDKVERIKRGKRRKDYDFSDIHPEDKLRVEKGEVNSHDKVRFICEVHGIYEQSLSSHHICSCPECGYENMAKAQRRRDYDFLHEIREDYRLKMMKGKINNNTKIPFLCEHHGEYWQTLAKHETQKHGCPECAILAAADLRRTKTFIGEEFLRADEYARLKTVGISQKDTAVFVCEKHGEYEQVIASKHSKGAGCPMCNMGQTPFSFYEFLQGIADNIVVNDREQIRPREIDFYLPDYKIGFEFNDIHTHLTLFENEVTPKANYGGKSKNYHYNKWRKAQKAGITLVHIWDVDWQDDEVREKMQATIINLLEGVVPKKEHKENVMKFYNYRTREVMDYCPDKYELMRKKCIEGKMARYYTCGIYWEAS